MSHASCACCACSIACIPYLVERIIVLGCEVGFACGAMQIKLANAVQETWTEAVSLSLTRMLWLYCQCPHVYQQVSTVLTSQCISCCVLHILPLSAPSSLLCSVPIHVCGGCVTDMVAVADLVQIYMLAVWYLLTYWSFSDRALL